METAISRSQNVLVNPEILNRMPHKTFGYDRKTPTIAKLHKLLSETRVIWRFATWITWCCQTSDITPTSPRYRVTKHKASLERDGTS